MGNPRQHARRKPGERSDLARRVWNRKQAGVSDQDLGTEFGLAKRTIRALVFEGKRLAGHTGRILPEKLREPRRWNQPATLQLKGSLAGDAMALALMSENRTADEPTHELQCRLGGDWQAVDVAASLSALRLFERQLSRRRRGLSAYWECRVTARVHR